MCVCVCVCVCVCACVRGEARGRERERTRTRKRHFTRTVGDRQSDRQTTNTRLFLFFSMGSSHNDVVILLLLCGNYPCACTTMACVPYLFSKAGHRIFHVRKDLNVHWTKDGSRGTDNEICTKVNPRARTENAPYTVTTWSRTLATGFT